MIRTTATDPASAQVFVVLSAGSPESRHIQPRTFAAAQHSYDEAVTRCSV